ncbi:unnamed protein product, partial [marine sediment metagenome]
KLILTELILMTMHYNWAEIFKYDKEKIIKRIEEKIK